MKTMDKPRLFSFTWHPYAIEPDVDYSNETPTLVEFKLEPKGTRHEADYRRIRLRWRAEAPHAGSHAHE